MAQDNLKGQDARVVMMQALREWSFKAFLNANNAAKRNLTGKVLKVRSGRLRRSLDRIGMPLFDGGYQIGTDVFYGILWEKGWTRPDFILRPKNAKALMFPVVGGFKMPQKGGSSLAPSGYSKRQIGRIKKGAAAGNVLFRKSIHFKAREFEPRSFLKKAILDTKDVNMRLLKSKLDEATRAAFPPQL